MPRRSLIAYPLVSTLALMAAIGLSAGLAGCGPSPSTAAAAPPRPVLVVSAEPAATQGPEWLGEVRARQRAELSFAQPGVVRQVLVEVGDKVRRGQLLATLDPAPSQAQLGAAQAEIQRLQAGLDEARRKHQRLQAAHQRQAAGEAEWTAAQAELSMAQAALAAAQAQAEGARWNRAQAELRAPMDGVIGLRQLEIGQAVGAGLAVLSIDGAGRELWALLPVQVGELRPGQAARLRTAHGELDSRLLRLSDRTEAGGARRAVFELPAQWRSGETLSVRLLRTDGPAEAVLVPLRAVEPVAAASANDGALTQGQVLRVRSDGGTVERVQVRLGQTQADRIEVLAGLKPGDRVVVAGGHSLSADARVKPVHQLR